jgi:hypothetical protein
LRTQLQAIEQYQGPLTAQIAQLTRERDDAARSLAGLRESLRTSTDSGDLLKLRAEATRLRSLFESARQSAGTNDPDAALAESWIAALNRIKATVEHTPEAAIPEFRLLTDAQWWLAAKDVAAGGDEREVLSGMRSSARNCFAQLARPALQKYVQTHNSQFPTDLTQLQPYFNSPVDDAVLGRWQIVPVSDFAEGLHNPASLEMLSRGSNPKAAYLVTQRASSLEEADGMRWLVAPNGVVSTPFKPIPKR